MKNRMTLTLALATLVAATSISPAFASHRTKVCSASTANPTGTITGGSFRSILVPENETCTLVGVTVAKDVVVLEGARLTVLGSTIGDDLRAENPKSIILDCRPATGACADDTSIIDDVVIRGTTSTPDADTPNSICNTSVGDDLEISDSAEGATWTVGGPDCRGGSPTNVVADDMEVEDNAGSVTIDDNNVAQDMEVDDNTGGVTITNNEIGDDLECSGNDPAPAGFNNEVHDDAKGQCQDDAFTSPEPSPSPGP